VIPLIGALVAFTLALAIGANMAGVHMAPAYGAGARSRRGSLLLFALFSAAGALTVGPLVLRSVGTELFRRAPAQEWPLLVLAPAIALSVVTIATLARVPFPTTLAAISAMIGVGLSCDILDARRALEILLWWVAGPVGTFLLTYSAGRYMRRFPGLLGGTARASPARRAAGWFLTVEGCYSAFAIGSNNTANAFAPLVAAGETDAVLAAAFSAAGFAAGALLWGGPVLDVVGTGITELCPVRATIVGFIAATGLLTASLFGVPVSGALLVTSGVLGFGLAVDGFRSGAGKRNVRRILLVWAAGPASAVIFAYLFTAWGH